MQPSDGGAIQHVLMIRDTAFWFSGAFVLLPACSHPTIANSREEMHAAIPAASRHSKVTYAQYSNILGNLIVSQDMVYCYSEAVTHICLCSESKF